MTTISQLAISATDVALAHNQQDAFRAGHDDAIKGHADRYPQFEDTPVEGAYRDGYAIGVSTRVQRDHIAHLVTSVHPVGRKYAGKHRRVAS